MISLAQQFSRRWMLLVLLATLAVGLLAAPVFAQTSDETPGANKDCPKDRQCLENPLAPGANGARPVEVTTILGIVIKGALGIVGSVALIVFIKGGASWLLSFGNPDRVHSGAMTMLWAAIGLGLVLASYFLLDQYLVFLSKGS